MRLPAELRPLVELLTRNGFDRQTAERLLAVHGEQRVRQVVGQAEHLREKPPGRIRNPAGYIRNGLEEGYVLVEGVPPARTGAELRARDRADRERRQEQDATTADRTRHDQKQTAACAADRADVVAQLRRLWVEDPDQLRPLIDRLPPRVAAKAERAGPAEVPEACGLLGPELPTLNPPRPMAARN